MSDPIPPQQEPPSPFDRPVQPGDARDERPRPPSRPGGGSGVKKPLLIGCGVILLLLAGALVFFYTNTDSFIAWTMEMIQEDLEPRLPEELPDDLRARFESAFEEAIAAARANPLAPETLESLQRLNQEFTAAVQGGGARLSVEEVERITEALEAFGGGTAEPTHVEAPDAGTD
jgi:hypothetical protein